MSTNDEDDKNDMSESKEEIPSSIMVRILIVCVCYVLFMIMVDIFIELWAGRWEPALRNHPIPIRRTAKPSEPE